MTSASLDRLLAAVLAVSGATGLLTIAVGAPDGAWLFLVHGVSGGIVLAVVVLKLIRSVPETIAARVFGRLALGGLLGVLALGSALAALLQAGLADIVVLGPWTLISWHAYAGLALGSLLALHLMPRRWRLLAPRVPRAPRTRRSSSGAVRAAESAPRISRRSLVQMGALAVVGAGMWSVAQVARRIAGGQQRFTGSRPLVVSVPPVTTFFGEPTPQIDLAEWRLRVGGQVATPTELSVDDLRALGSVTMRAVLDCTSGWSADCVWSGVRLADVIVRSRPAASASSVEVRAVTGWSAVLSMADVDRALLATHVGGAALAAGNGAPLRLVLPDRRGLEWVKWVDRIEVS